MDASVNQKAVNRSVDTNASERRLNLAQLAGLIGAVAGVWLLVSPFIIGYSGDSRSGTNDMIAGGLIAVLSGFCAAFTKNPRLRILRWIAAWIVAWVAGWVWIAPFVLAYTDNQSAMWNDFLTGVSSTIFTGSAMVYAAGIAPDEDEQAQTGPTKNKNQADQ